MRRAAIGGGLHGKDKGRMAAPTAPGAFAGALTADIGVVDLDPRPGGAKHVTAVAFNSWPASACAGSARRRWSRSRAGDPARCWTDPSCLEPADAWRETKPASAAPCPARRSRRSAMSDTDSAGIAAVDDRGSRNTLMLRTADT